MSEKEKTKSNQPKNIPKDGQVILSIMKEMGITEYEPKTLIQLTEFVYRYATSILEEARAFANSKAQKKALDLDDVRLALELSSESSFIPPPSREVIMECARNKNNSPLPIVKPHCGLRLPPDRHCLAACNYTLKSTLQRKGKSTGPSGTPGLKLATKPGLSYIKRTNPIGATKQAVTVPKPITKIASGQPQKTVLKTKIQITQNVSLQPSSISNEPEQMDVDSVSLKRKREDDNDNV